MKNIWTNTVKLDVFAVVHIFVLCALHGYLAWIFNFHKIKKKHCCILYVFIYISNKCLHKSCTSHTKELLFLALANVVCAACYRQSEADRKIQEIMARVMSRSSGISTNIVILFVCLSFGQICYAISIETLYKVISWCSVYSGMLATKCFLTWVSCEEQLNQTRIKHREIWASNCHEMRIKKQKTSF